MGVNKLENQGENWHKLLQKCQMTDFWDKNILTLGQIISGTKCDRDKLIFSVEREGQCDRVGHRKATQWDRIMSKTGVNIAEDPHHGMECPCGYLCHAVMCIIYKTG